jgi:hypothetical protein
VIEALRLRAGVLLPLATLQRVCARKIASRGTFTFDGTPLSYFFHSYNNFGVSERAIEVPIIASYLREGRYPRVLEIGNVTNHYYDTFRDLFIHKDVVDKFETGYNVINADIATFTSDQKYDFIFSISTFEHMDSDLGRNPDYVPGASRLISAAADNIKHVSDHLIAPGGRFVLTAPLLYTPEWDKTFYSDAFDACGWSSYKRSLFRRLGELHWIQVDVNAGRDLPGNPSSPFREYLSVVDFVK